MTLRTVVAQIPTELHDELVDAVCARVGDRTLDDVRLDIMATRAPRD